MTRTTRTSAALGLATVLTTALATGTATAAPAEAAGDARTAVVETMNATWDISGAVTGAPGNHHVGQLYVEDGPGTDSDTVFLMNSDYLCPDALTPDSGQCAALRSTSQMGVDNQLVLDLRGRLSSGQVEMSIPGSWDEGGVTTDVTLGATLDVAGTGSVTRTRQTVVWQNFTTLTSLERAGTVTGTIAGMSFTDLPVDLKRETYR
ncbi:hypothetical protein [Knoellia subterranea]|uniref:Cholesterol esterase n=1 Tax=Knoellia subterranea KCTC 19937 TaxID=1385521 RepID=A0A0A0JGX8_9MICO|nr:hypothetical protein [Knoellia subterranea]KGN36670.1 hypothetical protein N803_04020 [Knoellia subterranea KCTC 19937]